MRHRSRPTSAFVVIAFFTLTGAAAGDKPDNGKSIYEARCAPCHGVRGNGKGPEAFLLHPPPRDFTRGIYEYRSTESGSIPVDEDLARTITLGLPGTAMPAWGTFIRGDSLRAVIDYIKAFSPRFAEEKPLAVRVGEAPAASPGVIAAGKKVYQKLQCAGCHGPDGTGKGAVATDLQNDEGVTLRTPDLTEPWNFRGGSGTRDVFLRFRTGLDGTPMPSFAGTASEQEMWALARYVVSLGRKPTWQMDEQELRTFYGALKNQAREEPLKRGRYLVLAIGCADCHSPIRTDGSIMEELHFAGGQRWRLGPYGDVISANLTPDSATGIGRLTDDQLRAAITTGTRRDGSRMLPFPMPWTSFANLTPEDLNAIITYLRSLPPVVNRIPPPESRNIFSFLWGKFKMLVLRETFPVSGYPGNAGSAPQKKGEEE